MRVVFRLSAIVVAFLAIAGSLAACGQSGALYLPVVPPMPAPRGAVPASAASATDETASPDAASAPDAASNAASHAASVPDAADADDASSSADTDSSPLVKTAPAKAAPSSPSP